MRFGETTKWNSEGPMFFFPHELYKQHLFSNMSGYFRFAKISLTSLHPRFIPFFLSLCWRLSFRTILLLWIKCLRDKSGPLLCRLTERSDPSWWSAVQGYSDGNWHDWTSSGKYEVRICIPICLAGPSCPRAYCYFQQLPEAMWKTVLGTTQ